MPRGPILTKEERAVILALTRAGLDETAICKQEGFTKYIVKAFLSDPEGYGQREYNGRKRKVDDRGIRELVNSAKKTKMGSRRLVQFLNLPITARHARRLLADSGKVEYRKRKRAPLLTAKHQLDRKNWATEWNQRLADFLRTIFSDEKRFNLDGPDGLQYYWHAIGNELETYYSRQHGGGGFMVWAAFSKKGKTDLVFLEGKQKAVDYIRTLENHLLGYIKSHDSTEFIYQHDGATPHTAKKTKKFLKDEGIDVMSWPARSPDLNPMENLWGIMVQRVYDGGKQYATLAELKVALQKAWDDIDQKTLDDLLASMPNRLTQCIELKGMKTSY